MSNGGSSGGGRGRGRGGSGADGDGGGGGSGGQQESANLRTAFVLPSLLRRSETRGFVFPAACLPCVRWFVDFVRSCARAVG